MTRRRVGGVAAALAVAGLAVCQPARAQDDLDEAVAAARAAWLAHDLAALVASSDTMRLDVPGVAVATALRPGQAQRVLDQYLEPAREVSLEVAGIRRLADDHAYAEMERRYVVRGTAEEQVEMVLFGFRKTEGNWHLREVRVRR